MGRHQAPRSSGKESWRAAAEGKEGARGAGAAAVAGEPAGLLRGEGRGAALRGACTPVGAERAPRPAPPIPGGLRIPVPARRAGEAGRSSAGPPAPGALLLALGSPGRDPRCRGYRRRAARAPTGRGRVPRPRQVRTPQGWNAGSRAARGRAPGSRGCFRPGLGGGRGGWGGRPGGRWGKERSPARPTRLCLLCSRRWQRRGGRGGQRARFSAPRSPGNSCGAAGATSRGGGGQGAVRPPRADPEPAAAGARLGALLLRGPAGW